MRLTGCSEGSSFVPTTPSLGMNHVFPMQKWNCYPAMKSLLGLCLCKIVTAQSKQNILSFSYIGTTREATSNSLGPLGLCHTFPGLLVNVLRDDKLPKINFLQRSLTLECPGSVRYIQWKSQTGTTVCTT